MKQEWLVILGIQSEEEINEVDWKFISKFQKLPNDLIDRFADKVYWDNISQYQQLSPGFMKKYNLVKSE